MGVSFKISKTGQRFIHKPFVSSSSNTTRKDEEDDDDYENTNPHEPSKLDSALKHQMQFNVPSMDAEELEISFTLNLFPDGYSIGRPSENQPSYQAMLQDPPKFLHPYDRTSENLISAIECGRVPGDILDGIPCKYVDGTLLCQVRDYRNCSSEVGSATSSHDVSPITNEVRLRMSLENVVKDIPLISDKTWTYGDLMEVESRILKKLQPQLCLDPAPKLDRLCENPVPKKLNLDVRSLRKRRREMPEAFAISNNKIYGKKVSTDRVLESSTCSLGDVGPISGNLIPQHIHENAQDTGSNNAMVQRAPSFTSDASLSSPPFVSLPSKYPTGAPTMMRGSGAISNAPGASLSGQDMMMSYTENVNLGVSSSAHARRDNQDDPLSTQSSLNKRGRVTSLGPNGNHQQHIEAPVDSLQGSDLHWKNTLLHQQQFVGRGFQFPNNGMQKFPQQIYEGGLNQEAGGTTQFAAAAQQGMRFLKEEPVETDKSEVNHNRNDFHIMEADRNRMQQRLPPQHAFMRSNFPQPPWNNFGQTMDNNLKKEDQLQKRKSGQSPRVSGGGLSQSPLSSKSGEFSSGSVGPQFGPVITSGVGSSHKDKSAVSSVPAVAGATSLNSSANDKSMQRQQQVQLPAKRRSNSLTKATVISGVASPASVSNISVLLDANSPADEALAQVDQTILDKFSKIEQAATRCRINRQKDRVDEKPVMKPLIFPSQHIMVRLSSESDGENFIDESENKELSKSLVGGSMNACKIRVLTFVQKERIMQGNGFAHVPKSHVRMILSGNPSDGTIAMHYGDMLESDSLITDEYLPTLPNAHLADLLAVQLSLLMRREGYEIDDKIHPKPIRVNHAQQNGSGMPQVNAGMEIQQYSDAVSGQQPFDELTRPTNSSNPSLTSNQNVLNPRMLPQTQHALQISQGFLPGGLGPTRPQQNEPRSSSQQQPNQIQRSPVMLPSNQLPQVSALGQNSNAILGSNQMVYNKPSQLQIQLMQQQPPRKMMMGMGGNMANNMVGLGGLGNVMGMGGPTISGPMGAISGMGQNPMNLGTASNINAISQQIRSSQLMSQGLMAAKLGMMKRGMTGGAQSSLGGIAGGRQMHPGSSGLSMFGHSLNRGMNPMQRSATGPMGPPKPGMSLYMNQQIQQQQQLQQQQQPQLLPQQIQQHQQFQQQQLQQQDAASPLQAVVSPLQQLSQQSQQQQLQQQASPQQLNQRTPMSPQQMSQRTPMSPQLSSGAVHSLNMGNPEACPASPQLSSQTLGSVSSMANSPMEQLQGVNKNSSLSNS